MIANFGSAAFEFPISIFQFRIPILDFRFWIFDSEFRIRGDALGARASGPPGSSYLDRTRILPA
jgi:hypothetical protein